MNSGIWSRLSACALDRYITVAKLPFQSTSVQGYPYNEFSAEKVLFLAYSSRRIPVLDRMYNFLFYCYWYSTTFVQSRVPRCIFLFCTYKGTVAQDFRLKVFFLMYPFPPIPWVRYPIRAVFDFFSKVLEIFAAQGDPPVSLTQVWQMELIFNKKSFKYFVWTPLSIRDKFFSSSSL